MEGSRNSYLHAILHAILEGAEVIEQSHSTYIEYSTGRYLVVDHPMAEVYLSWGCPFVSS